MKHVLIVEDETDLCAALTKLIESEFPDVRVRSAGTIEDAALILDEAANAGSLFTVALLDAYVPLRAGDFIERKPYPAAFLERVRRLQPAMPLVLMSAYMTEHPWFDTAMNFAKSAGIYSYNKMDYGADIRELLTPLLAAGPMIELPTSGEIIRVCGQFERLLRDQSISQEALVKLSPRDFEGFIAELWRRFGYEVELTAQTRDGGRDIIAARRAETDIRILLECKRYTPPNKVGVELVRALYGVKAHERASKAILATSSSFTADAEQFLAVHKWELEGRDHNGIMEWIRLARSLN